MAGKYKRIKFSEINLNDPFFDSLKDDYIEFPEWFKKKCFQEEYAFVFKDEAGIGAFIYLKIEKEEIQLENNSLEPKNRLKIGTLCLAERCRGKRLGEGSLGLALWKWRDENLDEIYVTVFEKHILLIDLLKKFGFILAGTNNRGEQVYIKRRSELYYSDSYKAFPFINPNFTEAGIIPIYDTFHDKLFPYSELKNGNLDIEEETAGNGISKIYIATPYKKMHYTVGEPVFIYRIYQGETGKTYKSAITSYCTISNVEIIKENNSIHVSFDNFVKKAGNKTVFSFDELEKKYSKQNVIMLELVYNGYFGKGHNVNHKTLKESGLFEDYPYNITLSKNNFIKILRMGDVNVQNVIID